MLAPLQLVASRDAARGDRTAPDGDAAVERSVRTSPTARRWQEALATPAFWIFSIGAALYGLVASGIGLFNESILAERGFGPTSITRR